MICRHRHNGRIEEAYWKSSHDRFYHSPPISIRILTERNNNTACLLAELSKGIEFRVIVKWFDQISVPHNETDKVDWGGVDKMTLVEVGPRFCLNLIKIFGGSFGGPTLFENPNYISTNQIRALEERKKSDKYAKKVKAKTRRKMH